MKTPKSKEILSLTDKIRIFLSKDENKKYRDDDVQLALRIWNKQCDTHFTKTLFQISGYDLVMGMMNKKITNYDTITRARRKCQELYPETRGKAWLARNSHANEVRSNINR